LLAAVIATVERWNTIYFGTDTPDDETTAVAARTQTSATRISVPQAAAATYL
jgi:hypothetical protein